MAKKAFQWSSDRVAVGTLLASGKRPEDIPKLLEQDGHKVVTARTIYNWLKEEVFVAFVEQVRAEMLAKVRATAVDGSVRDKDTRLKYLDDLAQRLQRLFAGRSLDPTNPFAGADSGLLTVDDNGYPRLDLRLNAEMKSILDEAAKEMGERDYGEREGEGGRGQSLTIRLD